MKPSTINAIQAGLPTSSIVAAIFMTASPVCNVNISNISPASACVKPAHSGRRRRRLVAQPEPPEIDQHGGLQQFLRPHRQLAPAGIAAPEQRGNAVGE